MTLIQRPQQQPAPYSPARYSFEQMDGESNEDYALFEQFCEDEEMRSPLKFIHAQGWDIALTDVARRNAWISRRADFLRHQLDMERRRWLNSLDLYRKDILRRREKLQERIDLLMENEGVNENAIARAIKTYNDDLATALKVYQALGQEGGGITINAIAVNKGGDELGSGVRQMQESWDAAARSIPGQYKVRKSDDDD